MEPSRRSKERRRSQRLPLAVPIFARGLDDNGKEFLEFTTTLNISAGGVLLAMRRYLAPDSSVTLEIPAAPLPKLSARPKIIRAVQAHVTRVTRSEPSYLWALSFSSPLI
ncbi:MAG: PilZ domain-containing protein [Terriglobia bacterium]